ncbi:MAG: hypothetical protein CFE23_12940 [Flavobacterium sp. BFFFF1]|uniref:serine hydrolase n=1 Tax=Flavobacterium sp. BFFFF1 TaxID=2015557 RepID=UPI000BC90554|nr:serine hydrolase [Flavobacterium sp. BFFFF1]OYU79698.1 MAG: hypothetical protein CFE23_12940 [Flavobacterium sp. BFFFF1]
MPKLLTIAAVLLFSIHGFCQRIERDTKIVEVENSLMPYVPVKDFPGWNIRDRMKAYRVPGLSIAVIENYKISWAKGYGLADTIKKIPVDVTTMFSAGSISKLVTAAGAMILVEQGKLSLDTPINQFLTSWKINENEYTVKTPVTLRMLLSHTAGTSQSAYFGFTPDKVTFPTVVEILNGTPASESRPVVVNSEPVKEFRYSGGGSLIAQLAMMDATRVDFAPLMQQLIFGKLGMAHSTFEQPLPGKFVGKAAWAYSAASWFKGMPYVYPQQAAAGLYTTPTDLAKFFISLQQAYRGKSGLLSERMTKLMMTSQAKVSEGTYKETIGIGPFLIERADNTEGKGRYFEFTGVNAGFLAYGIGSVEGGNGVVIMLNSGDDVNGIGKEIRRAVAKTYGWYKFLPEEIIPTVLPQAQLEEYEGRYRKSIDEVIYIRREKNYLVEKINDGQDIYCFPVAKDTIAFTDYNVKGAFLKDSNGLVNALKIDWNEKPMMKMQPEEFSPTECLARKDYKGAKKGFRSMNMNEYAITYRIYDLLHQSNFDIEAARTLLEVATEQHPNAAIVYCRWGDFYEMQHNREEAIRSYRHAFELDPNDVEIREKLERLKQ